MSPGSFGDSDETRRGSFGAGADVISSLAFRSLAGGLVSPMPWFCSSDCALSSSISRPGSRHQAAAASMEPYRDAQAPLSWPRLAASPAPNFARGPRHPGKGFWMQTSTGLGTGGRGQGPSAGGVGEADRERPPASG